LSIVTDQISHVLPMCRRIAEGMHGSRVARTFAINALRRSYGNTQELRGQETGEQRAGDATYCDRCELLLNVVRQVLPFPVSRASVVLHKVSRSWLENLVLCNP
jgi:hypothetical protein